MKLRIECSTYNVEAEQWFPINITKWFELLMDGDCKLRIVINRGEWCK